MTREKKPISASQDIIREAKSIMSKFSGFTNGVRVLFLIHRSKEGAERANGDKMKKCISNNPDDFERILVELLSDLYVSEHTLRIYSSANERSMEKAIRQFKQEQLDADYYDLTSKNSFYTDIKNRFVGALMKPASRSETQFILDCDSTKEHEDSLRRIAELNIDIVNMYATKNGWHIITKPFNPNLFEVENVDINKDGLILLKY